MSDDSISRRAAIEAIEQALINHDSAIMRITNLPSAEPQWIPVKTRPMDKEEREYWSDHFGCDLEDEEAVLFDCKMPDDGQEILVSYGHWISMDKCEIDGGWIGLEGNGDWYGVSAWMPLPEPYRADMRGEEE